MSKTKYILITPAKNEGEYIEETIKSVVAQTIQPNKWCIVSDGSTDNTDEIIKKYAEHYNFIIYLCNDKTNSRNFASKVRSINLAIEHIDKNKFEHDFLGILDADTKFDKNYYETILTEFAKDEKLGIAGGFFYENYKGKRIKVLLDKNSVRGAVQFFKRECFDDIGGLIPLEEGGEDMITEITARMKGWKVRSFEYLSVINLRISGLENWGLLEAKFREGIREHSIGYHPLFQIAKSFYRINERPFVIAGMLHLIGYLWALVSNNQVKVSEEFMNYLRKEQLNRLFPFIKN